MLWFLTTENSEVIPPSKVKDSVLRLRRGHYGFVVASIMFMEDRKPVETLVVEVGCEQDEFEAKAVDE